MKHLRIVINFFSILISLWIVAFFWFVTTSPTITSDHETIADAVVVLTGGKGRVKLGYELVEKGLAKKLFITGVNKSVGIKSLKKLQNVEDTGRISVDLDYRAKNTLGNALEAAKWIKNNDIKTVRLVTASYHMKRSLIEFKSQMPQLTVIENPVMLQHSLSFNNFSLFFSEFHKYLKSLFKNYIFFNYF